MKDIARDIGTLRFWRTYFVHAFAALGGLVVLLELRAFAYPDSAALGTVCTLLIVGIALAFGLWQSWPRPIEETFHAPNMRIKVVEGDLFDQGCHLVIGVSDTFDVDTPSIISPLSVQAQAVDRLFGGDLHQFESEIETALINRPILSEIDKPGKRFKYGVGSVAVLRNASFRLYLSAYSEMNESNEARSTTDGIWKSLSMLWETVSKTANGGAVAIPVIGGGQSRISQVLPAQDSVRLTILSFMFASRRSKICDELRVVVRPEDFKRLDRLELSAFLSSLRPS